MERSVITALNPGVELPDTGIIPVHRSDGSGTSFIFTDYLSSVNPAWADSVGKGASVKWPARLVWAPKATKAWPARSNNCPARLAMWNCLRRPK